MIKNYLGPIPTHVFNEAPSKNDRYYVHEGCRIGFRVGDIYINRSNYNIYILEAIDSNEKPTWKQVF